MFEILSKIFSESIFGDVSWKIGWNFHFYVAVFDSKESKREWSKTK